MVDNTSNTVVGTGGYCEVPPDPECDGNGEVRAAEIRKMYLAPEARGKRLGQCYIEALYIHTHYCGQSSIKIYYCVHTVYKQS